MKSACLALALAAASIIGAKAFAAEAGKPAYVVTVDYSADAKNIDALKVLIDGVAKASIGEPGCRRFDVVQPASAPTHIFLYEVFDDAAAFQAHAAAPYFKQFGAESTKIGATRVATPGTMVLSLQKP